MFIRRSAEVIRLTEQLSEYNVDEEDDIPADQIFRLPTKVDIVGECKMVLPLHDFLVCVVRRFGTERRIANQTLKCDGA
jgi:hypothetical protein